uniref:GDSL esterase/lipase At1g09390-like n=1 Tax=Nelumbo nucifera TaxID=4432 RepID=A0A822Z0X1_NELNU|nr:TPA_asm: hypothetical protein HUJ06_009021 [Nelumbo nucifera]
MQFLHFKTRSLQITTRDSRHLVDGEAFQNALYMIDIGQNDLADSFSKNLSYARVVERIPSILAEIKNAVKTIYDQGGRNFWIHSTGPLGCLPQKLTMVPKTRGDLDRYGCLRSYNDAAKVFNGGLVALCEQMRSELRNSTIVYVDIFAIKYDLIANPTKYGESLTVN